MLRVLIALLLFASPLWAAERWNGSAWETVPAKRYNGSAWVDTKQYRYNGSAWVDITPSGGTSFSGATDTFDRTDADALGSLSGGTYSWTEAVGDIDIVSNVASSTASSVAVLNSPVDLSSVDVTVYNNHNSTTWRESGVVFWYTDSSNYWRATYSPNNVSLDLIQVVSGTPTNVATFTTNLSIYTDSNFSIRVVATSSSVVVYCDKSAAPTTARITYTTGAPYSHHGNIGIYASGASVSLNDFSASAP